MSQLTNQILFHIYNNLGIFGSHISILSNSFLIPQNIILEGNHKINLYGTQISINNSYMRILCGDFSDGQKEYALIIKLDNCPAYGCYLAFDSYPKDGMIAFQLNNNWLDSNVFIQANFLAGMEQLKDISAAWNSISKYNDLIEDMKSFIQYHDSNSDEFEEDNEGQKTGS